MGKGAPKGKSSASSATRKKQASKAAKKVAYERDEDGNLLHPDLVESLEKAKQRGPQRGQKKDKSKQDGKGGKKGKVEKKKQYIPPPKPPQPLPDPLDSMGLASLLPADLVVLLRKASKKDVITRCRALEGLLAWVEDALGKSPSSSATLESNAEASNLSADEKRDALVMMLPSWVHLFPRLALSPTRRLRLLTMQIQSLLLEKPQTSSQEVSSTRAELLESPQYIEPILGPWAILCHDTDRTIERLGRSAWIDSCTWKGGAGADLPTETASAVVLDLNEHCDLLVSHLRTILLSPSPSFALSMTSAHAVASSDPAMSRTSSGYATPSLNAGGVERDAKNRDDSNVEEDTAALDKRLVAGALAVLISIIRQQPSSEVTESLQDVLSSRLVWASLSPHNLASSSTARPEKAVVTSFGFDSPAVRSRAWTLLRSLLDVASNIVDQHVNIIGPVAMTSVWSERDNAVQRITLDAILPLLKKRPQLWLMGANQFNSAALKEKTGNADSSDDEDQEGEEEEDSDDENENDDGSDTGTDDPEKGAAESHALVARSKPHSYISFLQWLQSACGGAPHLGYSAVVVFISTIPAEILPHDDFDSASELLSNFFSALYSRPLDFDPVGCRAFFAAFTECVTYMALRMLRAPSGAGKDNAASAAELIHVHFGAAWSELVLPKPSVLSRLGTSSEDQDGDETSRAQRIKSIGSTRVVSDLAVQVRRAALAAPESQVHSRFLAETEADLVEITHALSNAKAVDESSARTYVLSALERATSFYAALAPSQNQPGSVELRRDAARNLGKAIRLAASGLVGVAADIDVSSNLKHTRATLLCDYLCLLLRSAVSAPDALDAATSQALVKASIESVPQLMGTKAVSPTSSASFLAAFLPLCADKQACASIWTATLSSVAVLGELQDRVDALSELFVASEAVAKAVEASHAEQAQLPRPSPEAGTEELAIGLVTSLCDSASLPNELRYRLRNVVAKLLSKSGSFVDASCVQSMLSIICSTIEQLRNTLLERSRTGEDGQTRQRAAAVTVADLLSSLDTWIDAQSSKAEARRVLRSAPFAGVLTAVSELMCLDANVPNDEAGRADASTFRDLAWSVLTHVLEGSSEEERKEMRDEERSSLQDHLLDIHVPVAALVGAAGYDNVPLPDPQELREMLLKASRQQAHPALLVFDPLVPQHQASDIPSATSDSLLDGQGLGIFARVCAAVLQVFDEDRAGAKQYVHLLPYVVLLSILIEDDLLLPGTSKHALDSSMAPEVHRGWLRSSVTVVTALISSLSNTVTENWHNDMVASLQRSSPVDAEKDGIGHVLSVVWKMACELDTSSSYLARVFHRLLNAAFNFGTVTEAGADRWLKLGDAVQDRMPAMSSAIFHAAKPIAGSSPTYDRLRNGAAAKLAGLGPDTAEERVLHSLRTLVALAPPEDSELPIIPQQRAIFLLKDLQKLYSSEDSKEYPAEETCTRLAELFIHLLPVVQDVQGSHIDFIFDMLLTNLEFCSLADDATVAQLYHNLRLLETVRDLASRNANLREYWKDRSVELVDLVRNQFLSLPGLQSISAPKQACIDLIVDLVRETSESPFKLHETAGPLCKLLVQSPSHEVQVISYRLLSGAIREHVKELVVESAVDRESLATEEGQKKLKLPEALVANISESLSGQLNLLVEEEAARRTGFGYFLSWIAVFEHFEGASLSVKSAFLGEIEKRNLLVESFLPTVFALVGLADESRRPFDPSRFALEEVFLDQVDAESSLTVLQVLAAHVYLRSLIHMPTTVRGWWVDIKDRQHSMQIASFTTRHLSPIIANRELSHLREPEALSKLQDEALSIKILSTNEVIATYVVDEHPMEIGVKIPADFPLHGVEIRDIQRVGITEAKWRSWLLAVQQLITGQNGLIFDALSLFKRNAEVQFQGLDECAICYSIISPMDRSLPTKPCKTCKNKFHAGCLFKWISTSGASTCPLCRSIL